MSLNVPTILETPRIILKIPCIEHALAWQQAMQESLADLKLWLHWAQYVPTLEKCTENALKASTSFNEKKDVQFYIFSKIDGTFIGGMHLVMVDWKFYKFEIGYWIRTSCQRQGYATEATRAITAFAFECLHAKTVLIKCDDNNLGSKSVAKNAGFALEKVLKNHGRTPTGQLSHTAIFLRTNTSKS